MITPTLLTLHSVACQLPDGRLLFSDLNESFDTRHTGLVGRNGVGKSLLARVMAGERRPSAGSCQRFGSVRLVHQQVACSAGQTVIDLAGLRATIDALDRIESGGCDAADFDQVGDDWDIRQRLSHALAATAGLNRIDPDTPVERLSGGQRTRVMLAGAFVAQPDLLILDEPSNHLDRTSRQWLLDRLADWSRGLIVVSHDRELLGRMQRIVALSPSGLRSYGGNYGVYAQASDDERSAAQRELARRKLERQRDERELRVQRERLERRQTQGSRAACTANQAPILLGRQKARSEASMGRHLTRQAEQRRQLDAAVRVAASGIERESPVLFRIDGDRHAPSAQRLVELDGLVLPHLHGPRSRIDLLLTRGMRVGVVGDNGQGKSVLLSVLAGRMAPQAGRCVVQGEVALLDQHLGALDPERSVLDQFRQAHPGLGDSGRRLRLAQLGLDADRIGIASGSLSGGERVRAAMACAVYREAPADLLLLDEPGNHLDLAAQHALEAMLHQYAGTVMVVSHDPVFLDALALSHRLRVDGSGWRLDAWENR